MWCWFLYLRANASPGYSASALAPSKRWPHYWAPVPLWETKLGVSGSGLRIGPDPAVTVVCWGGDGEPVDGRLFLTVSSLSLVVLPLK